MDSPLKSLVGLLYNFVPYRTMPGGGRIRTNIDDGDVYIGEYSRGGFCTIQSSYVTVNSYPGLEARIYGSQGALLCRLGGGAADAGATAQIDQPGGARGRVCRCDDPGQVLSAGLYAGRALAGYVLRQFSAELHGRDRERQRRKSRQTSPRARRYRRSSTRWRFRIASGAGWICRWSWDHNESGRLTGARRHSPSVAPTDFDLRRLIPPPAPPAISMPGIRRVREGSKAARKARNSAWEGDSMSRPSLDGPTTCRRLRPSPHPSCRHPSCRHPSCRHPSCRHPSCRHPSSSSYRPSSCRPS